MCFISIVISLELFLLLFLNSKGIQIVIKHLFKWQNVKIITNLSLKKS